ncbi:AAA 11 domain containing protein, partial [Asbolus verrucosus]
VPMNIKYDDILVLEVPGLAEKRPSVIVGDLIDIRVHDDLTAYRGIVKCVNDKTIDISYVDDELVNYIKQDPNMLLDVAFTLNRLTFERMHEAVDKVACNMLAALFPNHVDTHGLSQRNFRNIDFYNKNITNNPEQKDAVIKIVNNAQISPYIVFGPPGTGKTITIVEAILQIKESTTKRILVCAPANSACDNIAIMLLPHCTKSELLRIHSDTRETSTLTEELKKYSNMEVEGIFTKMSVDEIMKFRIVVTTLMLIGRYRNYKCDCVFIDEAAQASEPETNIALGLLTAGGQLILAGDPKQLGPM